MNICKTQHYSDISLIENLTSLIVPAEKLVEPFVGCGNLLQIYSGNWELYDLQPKDIQATIQDTLLNLPNYTNKTVITNPPFLARNKNPDKTIYNKYGVSDLYQAFLKTLVGAKNGILILPLSFLTNSQNEQIRMEFFSQYKLVGLNIFTEKRFDNTTINVCSFAFEKGSAETFNGPIWLNGKPIELSLSRAGGWKIGGEWLKQFEKVKPIFIRYTSDTQIPTCIDAELLDTQTKPFHLYFSETPYKGLQTDRMKATLVCNVELSLEQQHKLIEKFNAEMTTVRETYHNLIFSTYRDFGRKRLGLTELYKILTQLYYNLN